MYADGQHFTDLPPQVTLLWLFVWEHLLPCSYQPWIPEIAAKFCCFFMDVCYQKWHIMYEWAPNNEVPAISRLFEIFLQVWNLGKSWCFYWYLADRNNIQFMACVVENSFELESIALHHDTPCMLGNWDARRFLVVSMKAVLLLINMYSLYQQGCNEGIWQYYTIIAVSPP